MTKSEITLELVKIAYQNVMPTAGRKGDVESAKTITEMYNSIYNGIIYEEQNK
jgi:hypothetical protein